MSIKEDAGAAAVIELRKKTVTGQVVVYINFAADETVTFELARDLAFEGGVYVKEVSGSITGVLWGN